MPPREIKVLQVPWSTHAKLAANGIGIDEVREAVANAPDVRRGPKNASKGQAGRCYFVVGRTESGRILKVLVRRFDGGTATLITAWEGKS